MTLVLPAQLVMISVPGVLYGRGDKDYVCPSKRNVPGARTRALPRDGASCSKVGTLPGTALAHAPQHGLTECPDMAWELTESGGLCSEQGNRPLLS